MADYTVTVIGDAEYALAYALEMALAHPWTAPDESEPPPPPTLEDMPQLLVNADLTNRLRDLDAQAQQVLPTLLILDPASQDAVLTAMASPALQAYVRHLLATGGG